MPATPIDAFNNWFQRKFGRAAPGPDGGAAVTLGLAATLVDAGVSAGTQDASARATRLAIGMTNFIRPGTVTSPTYFTMWHAALMDAAGIDADAEWLVTLNERVVARDWLAALVLVKAHKAGSATSPTQGSSAQPAFDRDRARTELVAIRDRLNALAALIG